MNFRFCFCGCLAAVFLLGCTSTNYFYSKQPAQMPGTIAVLPISDFSQLNSGKLIQNTIIMELKTSGMKVVEREQFQQLIDEKSFPVSRLTNSDVEKLGTALRANYLLIAAITSTGAFYLYSATKR